MGLWHKRINQPHVVASVSPWVWMLSVTSIFCPLVIGSPRMHLSVTPLGDVHAHTRSANVRPLLSFPPLPTSALFKGFGPHVTWHLSADNGIYSQLLSRSALSVLYTHTFHTHVALLLNAVHPQRRDIHIYHHYSPLSVTCMHEVHLDCEFTQSMW